MSSAADDFMRRRALVLAALKRNSTPTSGGGAPAPTPAKPLDARGTQVNYPPVAPRAVPPVEAELELPALSQTSVTLSRKQMERDAKLARRRLGPAERPIDVDAGRPKTRGDCFGGERPCPYVGCRYHTYLDVTPAGSLVINHPDIDPSELSASCSLDIADRGGITLEAAGQMLNVTRERARQLEQQAMQNLAVAVDPKAAAAAGVPGARFIGSCRARCALTGKYCALPSHGRERKHRIGHHEFHLVALEGQTYFPRAHEVDGYALSREAADVL